MLLLTGSLHDYLYMLFSRSVSFAGDHFLYMLLLTVSFMSDLFFMCCLECLFWLICFSFDDVFCILVVIYSSQALVVCLKIYTISGHICLSVCIMFWVVAASAIVVYIKHLGLFIYHIHKFQGIVILVFVDFFRILHSLFFRVFEYVIMYAISGCFNV